MGNQEFFIVIIKEINKTAFLPNWECAMWNYMKLSFLYLVRTPFKSSDEKQLKEREEEILCVGKQLAENKSIEKFRFEEFKRTK